MTAACVYIAAREAKIPRKIEDIGEAFDMTSEVEMKELKRTISSCKESGDSSHHRSRGVLREVHSDLGSPAVLGMAREIWDQVKEDLSWQGKKPSGIAGVVIYFASQNSTSPRTQSEVCSVSGISEVTLRGLLKILNRMVRTD